MNIARQKSLQLLMQETSSLISLPEVCLKLREILANPRHTRQEVTDTIKFDPSLTTRLLRIVNSAYFGLPVSVKDVSHALGMLGEEDLNNLIIVTSIVQTMNSIGSGFDLKKFWKSSIFCAVLAKNIAQQCQKNIKEEIFIAGLLLNVGKLLLYSKEPELLAAVEDERLNSGRKDFIIEEDFLGFNHSDVGAAMAKIWNFSELMSQAISTHHELAEPESKSVACQITYLAGYCSDHFDFESLDNNESQKINSVFLDRIKQLNISEQQFPEILANSHADYSHAYEAFCGGQ